MRRKEKKKKMSKNKCAHDLEEIMHRSGIHSLPRYLLSTCSVLRARDTAMNKTDKISAFTEFFILEGGKTTNKLSQ